MPSPVPCQNLIRGRIRLAEDVSGCDPDGHAMASMARDDQATNSRALGSRNSAPRIHGELLKLGFAVSQSTVSRTLRSRPRRPSQSWITFLRNQLGATPTASHNDVRPLVRDCESCSQRRPHTTFRNRKAGCDERSQPATERRRIGPPFQFQPGLTYVLPGRARSPPCVPPLSTGKPQRNLRLRRCSTADHHMYHRRRVHGTGEAPTNPHLPYPLRATTLPAIGASDNRIAI